MAGLNVETLGIFATRATIESCAYQNEIAKYNPNMRVFGQFCPDWVHIVEENSMNDANKQKLIRKDLEIMLRNCPEKIVLGCTHYPFLTDVLSKFVPKSMFIDPAINFAEYIKSDLEVNGLLSSDNNAKEEFYVSSNPQLFQSSAKMFYEVKELPKLLIF